MNNNCSLVQPPLCNLLNINRFKGIYRLVGYLSLVDRYKRPYLKVRLSDIHGEITAYLFDSLPNKYLVYGALLQLEASIKNYNKLRYIHLVYIESVSYNLAIQNTSLDTLPISIAPQPKALSELKVLVDTIQNQHLKQFLAAVLISDDVCIPFIQSPASLNYHHNYAGGLLTHSVEVAKIVSCFPWKSSTLYDLALIAALLHDVGKIKTLSPSMKRTNVGKIVDHDSLTLEICAIALEQLDQSDPQSANLLRHIWTCSSPGARYGYKAITAMAHVIQAADRISADNSPEFNNE